MKKHEIRQPEASTAAVIYARYSSHAQNDASIEQQVTECREYAAAHDLKIIEVYADRAVSGRSDRRPEFQKMIRHAEAGKFQAVITYKSNRIARNMLDALRYEERLEKAGVKVIYCKEQFGDNAAGRLALRMMMSLNEFYSENMAEDIRRGMIDAARQGKVSGAIPLGYKKGEDGKYAIDEPMAEIVREIFHRVSENESLASIADDLNARGIRTAFRKPWGKSSFVKLLSNERYTGVYIFAEVRIEGGMPVIVDKALFDAVQEKIRRRKEVAGRRRDSTEYLLTGKLFEYLASGRPILCIGPEDGDAARILKETQAGVTVRFEDRERMKETVKGLYQKYLENGLPNNSNAEIERYSRRELTKQYAKILNQIES